MKKASEYRQHAEECRALAASMTGEQRSQMLHMAGMWDRLAAERSESLRKEPEGSVVKEQDEEIRRAAKQSR